MVHEFSEVRAGARYLKFGIVGLIALIAGGGSLLGSWYTIDQAERGVILRNGAFQGIAQPGLNFKLPWFDSVQKISLRSQKIRQEKFEAYSADQQPTTLALSVIYHVDPSQVENVYVHYQSNEGLENRLIIPQIFSQVKNAFGQYTALKAVQSRVQLTADAGKYLREALQGYPVIVESVQIENIDFSPAYEKSIEDKMQAEIEVSKYQQNLQREKIQAEITVTKANADAASYLAKQKAEGDATEYRGNAEAKAIRARGEALKENPGLVELTKAERWNGVLPTTMPPLGSLPIINVGDGRQGR